MVTTILYFILGALGLSFLVFIHELGHYIVARRKGMRVEVFSIGFGKPIYQWKKDNVQWQICYLLFGGYVKIAGMERQDNVEPYQIPDGFYAKKPKDRIKVALAGPIVNILFAFVCFLLIWGLGGRLKPFSEFTHYIGWVDPKSELYQKGIRPGDEIVSLNGRKFTGFKDLIYSGIITEKNGSLQGYKINYYTGEKEPFYYSLDPYEDPRAGNNSFLTIGITSPASYLIYNQPSHNQRYPSSPIIKSGIQEGDRIVWADGEIVFSVSQLKSLINQPRTLLTIQRGEEIFLDRVPRIKIRDMKITGLEKSELDDWQHSAGFRGNINLRYFIPFNVNYELAVEKEISFIDEESRESKPSGKNSLLQPGDRIIAVDGRPVENTAQLFSYLQKRKIQLIAQRAEKAKPVAWQKADQAFENSVNWKDLYVLQKSLGVPGAEKVKGDLVVLRPIAPISYQEAPLTPGVRKAMEEQFQKERKQIEKIENKEKKEKAIKIHEENQGRLILGFSPQDRLVRYNPSPMALFSNVLGETWRTISALVMGDLSPKYLSGPVGIVHVMQYSWTVGFKEAIYWLGLISLNLGILNLLPLPVLDGGHICFSLYEAVTKKRIKAKTMERLIIPFVILLVVFFIYVTYQDILRLFGRFF
ncbi:MAG: site-2 protease family protein [Simkaniaceae bacterium]